MKQISILLGFLIILITSCMEKMQADLILYNGQIYTVDSSFSLAEALVVKDGKIVETGNSNKILKQYTADNIIDLAGKSVYPGFIDPHCHFYGYGTNLRDANLKGTRSFHEVIEMVKLHSELHTEGWITGRGWDQNDWETSAFPDNSILDELFPDRPVFLTRIDGHAALVNSKALEIANIQNFNNIEGGSILMKNGKPTGILIDNAVQLVSSIIPKPGKKESERALLDAQLNCLGVGLVSVHDCGLDAGIIELIDQMHKDKYLKMRVYAMLNPNEENFEKFLYKGIYKTDRLHVASLKLYADGALGSRGALLIEPYTDNQATRGLQVASTEYLQEMAALAYKYGFQVNTHCIGDSANRLMLKIYSGLLEPGNDRRWRIEHAQVVHPEDLHTFGKYSIIPSIQATHATSDMYWADERLGSGRIRTAYTYRSLLRENGWIPNGSDFPIEDINPIYGFYAAVVRKDHTGWPEDGFQPSESLSREEALRAMTIWAAKAAFEENESGSLEKGKLADFVVTDRNIMKIPESEIPHTRVLQTWIAGEKVFEQE